MDHPATPPVDPTAGWHSESNPVPVSISPERLRPSVPLTPQPHITAGQAVRKLAHVGVGFLGLFLVVRAFGLEPFGVPTGSMAETLLGNRKEATCPRCGYPIRVGHPARERAARFDDCRCPNCASPVDLSDSPDLPGDRLLVDKTAYHYRPPRRWEVAVFRCPVDPSKPYVKRVAGLPSEAIQVIDGDVYANGELARKTLEEVRQTRVPFFDMNFAPQPDGWKARWLVEPSNAGSAARTPKRLPSESVEAGPDILRDGDLTLDGSSAADEAVALTYRHWQFEARDDDPVRDALAYNDAAPLSHRAVPVHDFILECELEIVGGAGAFAVRLGDGADFASGELPIGTASGSVSVEVETGTPNPKRAEPLRREQPHPGLLLGKSYRLEFAFADRRVSLAVDGQEVIPAVDLPPAGRRGGVRKPLQIGVRGASVRVKNLKLFHDIHYRSDGSNAGKTPYQLGADEYFMLGDNSPDSHDSRGWAIPGVPERDFVGKPFLVHQPMRLGRVAVNGRERVYQSVDWDRLRWLR